MDFFADLRREIVKVLPHDAANPAIVSALNKMSDFELLTRFFNWLDRHVHAHPRIVELSPDCTSALADHQPDIGLLIDKIRRGGDLTPHLSKDVMVGYTTRAKNKPSKDLDLLLNDWGIHHLHLSQTIKSDGFVKRGGPLLFAIFTREVAYLLDVMPHGQWENQRLVEIAARNWPNRGLFIQLALVDGISSTITQADRKTLRHCGVLALVEVDGKVYASRTFGISSAGTSSQASRRARDILHWIKALTEKMNQEPDCLRPIIETAATYPSQPDFSVAFWNGSADFGFVVREARTGVAMPIPA
jgi:hypothetical protein